jgi:hypothetical protein
MFRQHRTGPTLDPESQTLGTESTGGRLGGCQTRNNKEREKNPKRVGAKGHGLFVDQMKVDGPETRSSILLAKGVEDR